MLMHKNMYNPYISFCKYNHLLAYWWHKHKPIKNKINGGDNFEDIVAEALIIAYCAESVKVFL